MLQCVNTNQPNPSLIPLFHCHLWVWRLWRSDWLKGNSLTYELSELLSQNETAALNSYSFPECWASFGLFSCVMMSNGIVHIFLLFVAMLCLGEHLDFPRLFLSTGTLESKFIYLSSAFSACWQEPWLNVRFAQHYNFIGSMWWSWHSHPSCGSSYTSCKNSPIFRKAA